MSSFTIKVIAITTMAIDHIGLFFFPHFILFHVVGRLAFPLFAWLIANGALYTKNIKHYALRLFLLACVAQIPYLLANRFINPSFGGLNVVFTLFLGLTVITVMQKTSKRFLWILATIGAAVIADTLRTDYGAEGVLAIVCFYLFYNEFYKMVISQILILFIFPYITLFLEIFSRQNFSLYYADSYFEFIGLFSLLFISQYNKRQGYKTKYLFYYFYPLQYLAIFLVELLLAGK